MNILVGDIGGTKSILAIVDSKAESIDLLDEKSYQSTKYKNLEAIVNDYLNNTHLHVDRACLAVAGPITNNQAHITNLSWIVDTNNLRSAYNLSSIELINDLEAIAFSIPFLNQNDFNTIYKGSPINGGNIAVIAPGTGLGEAFLTFNGISYRAHASEGSHASFSPINNLQMELLTYLHHEKGLTHVSFERVCSGAIGIPLLYNFLKETGKFKEPKRLTEKFAICDDPTPIIIESAQKNGKNCTICDATLDLFCDILAVETGNLALKVLSTGGIFLAGGIPPRILNQIDKPSFLNIVQSKGRFQKLLAKMPVNIIINDRAGLIGAAAHSFQSI